ncbi:MAG: isoleucine--tRNA ligase [Thermoplasmata archaeon]
MATEESPSSGAPPPTALQRTVAEYWARTGVVERALADRPGAPPFRFTEGPPSANGRPHAGHPIARTMKDLQLRYRRMRGMRIVSPMAGWDCHGLPVEIAVERKLGLRSVKEIEAFGADRFCEECRGIALEVAGIWEEMSGRLGYWLDYRHAYYTMAAPYIESVWWSLRQLFDRGLLYRGHYVLPYCPRCETSLSSHEVAQGYREVEDPSITVRFPLRREPGAPARDLLVWTTTPWTLPSNLFVVARADLEYSVVREPDGREVVLATEAIPRWFTDPPAVVERLRGEALAGLEYAPPFDAVPPGPGRFRVVLDAMVDAAEGTGLVHGAPSFGADDYRVGQREGAGTFDPLTSRGVFTDRVPLVAGRPFKAADPILIADLDRRGLLWRVGTIRHTYPFCWRCESPLLYRALDSWFVRTSAVAERLVRHNGEVAWIPAHLKAGRFGNFLAEAKDWALSRSRFWGTPLPIWRCPDGHATCIGSFAELAERWGRPLPDGFDPHRVGVDPIAFPCPTCGAEARREPYTIDVWYDSGAAPFAQYHYPFEPGPFDPAEPLDYVAEGIDQTRGWFYTLLVLATALFDRPAFKVALVNGHSLDDLGKKMSKSKGNVLDPLALLDHLGGDALRWYVLTTDFTEGLRMSEGEIRAAAARTLGPWTNAVAFYVQNARADGLPPHRGRPRTASVLDRWILSRLATTRREVSSALDRFDPRPAAAALRAMVDDVSTWYLRRSRPRFWAAPGSEARREAHETLGHVLAELALLAAPLVPFTAEWTHQEIAERPWASAEGSVHLAAWPEEGPPPDPALEEGMRELRARVEIGRELRQRAGVRARIPLPAIAFAGAPPPALAALGAEGEALLAEELNVREVRWVPSPAPMEFPEEDWVARTEGGAVVAALTRRPTPELLEEGMLREALRRIQEGRKEAGLRFTDRIALLLAADPPLRAILARHRETIAREALADAVDLAGEGPPASAAEGEPGRLWEFDGHRLLVRIRPAGPEAPAAHPPPPAPPARAPAAGTGGPPVSPRARPARRASARPRPRRRTAPAAPPAPARRRGGGRPSRRPPRGRRPHPSPARRRPAAGAARRPRRVRARSAHPVRPRRPRRSPRRRPARRRSARAA